MEDWKRKKSDDEENNRSSYVYDKSDGFFYLRNWSNIKLGNIVKVRYIKLLFNL